MYVISFGNSSEYVMRVGGERVIDTLRDEVKRYLHEKFPENKALKFYENMTVKEIPADREADYAGYQVFDPLSLEEIKRVLDTEIRDQESLQRLNSNAAFGG